MTILAEVEKETIRKVLADNGGNLAKSARELGIDRRTLYRKIEAYGWRVEKEITRTVTRTVVDTEVVNTIKHYLERRVDIQDVE